MKSAILLAVLLVSGEYENCAQHLKNGAAMIFDVGVGARGSGPRSR